MPAIFRRSNPLALIDLLLGGLGGEQSRATLFRQFRLILLEACHDAAAAGTYACAERVIIGGTSLPQGLGARGRSALGPGRAGAAAEVGNDSNGGQETKISPMPSSDSGSQWHHGPFKLLWRP